ncbi:MAG: hypothetical protein V4581_06755 [Bacteroidota bacterium]
MKRLNLLYSAIFAFASVSAFAQINQTPVHSGGQIYVSKEKELAATGSMYVNEAYQPAKLSTNDNIMLLRYNAYQDYFEMSNPQEQAIKQLPKDKGVTITFNSSGEAYTIANYKTEDGNSQLGYLNVIADGAKVKIYKRERVYLQAGKSSANSYQSAKAASYKKADDEFYVKVGNAVEASFFDGKKDFAKLVPGKEKEVLEYIKKNNIDTEKAADLQKLATFVETII